MESTRYFIFLRKKNKTQIPKLVIYDKDINDPHKIHIPFNSYFTET